MMQTDEEGPRPAARFSPLLLDRLAVDELESYISELRAEIARVEADIERKRSHRSAADSFFKPRD
jgi:uncharacterized small protein (DUF1192 family)